MHARTRLGRAAESYAADWLEREGYRILDRNWRCEHGEVDLVAAREGYVVIVEVKSRRGRDVGLALEAVTGEKLRRLRVLAGCWHAAHPEVPGRLRLDAIGIALADGAVHALSHVRGIGA